MTKLEQELTELVSNQHVKITELEAEVLRCSQKFSYYDETMATASKLIDELRADNAQLRRALATS